MTTKVLDCVYELKEKWQGKNKYHSLICSRRKEQTTVSEQIDIGGIRVVSVAHDTELRMHLIIWLSAIINPGFVWKNPDNMHYRNLLRKYADSNLYSKKQLKDI